MDSLTRAIDVLNRWVRRICIVFSGALFILVIAQILCRYVIKVSAPWTEEAARYLMIWMALLAAGIAFQKGQHFNIDFLTSRLGAKTQKKIALFTGFLTFLFILCIILWGVPFAILGFFTISPGLEITMFLPYLAIPVAGGVMMLNLIVYLGGLRGGKGKEGPESP
ncbi:MAG: TRAP transporter small permease [Deltaproteobacteria bacterium]|nr:MAG: TRAP transporter small permease [Deltaproteobacteria bacterium]